MLVWVWVGLLAAVSDARAQSQKLDPGPEALAGLRTPREWTGPSDYTVARWGREHGLPHDAVYALAQTPDGYLWLGTEFGASRFDGLNFAMFSAHQVADEMRGRISSLFVDGLGRFWAGSRDGGLCRLENGRFVPINDGKAGGVFCIGQGTDGTVWVGHGTGLGWVDGDRIVTEKMGQNLADGKRSSDLAVDPISGQLYYLSWNAPGMLKDGSFQRLVQHGGWQPGDYRVDAHIITARREGGVWLVQYGEGGKALLRRTLPDHSLTKAQMLPFEVPMYSLTAFLEDRAGNLWLAVESVGVYRISPEGVYERVITGNNVAALFEDDEGNIWAGSGSAGLYRIKRRTIWVFPASARDPVISVGLDRDDNVLFNTDKEEIMRLQGGKVSKINLRAFQSFLVDDSGDIWTSHWNLNRYHPLGGDAYASRGNWSGPPYLSTKAMIQDSQGGLWIGSHLGLACFAQEAFTVYSLSDHGFSTPDVRALEEGAEGGMWIGTNGDGLYRMTTDGAFHHFRREHGLGSDVISALYADAEGTLWVGTVGGGLTRIADGRLTTYTKADGLPDDTVCSIIEDEQGDLWLGTFNGIVRVAKNALETFIPGTATDVGPLPCVAFGTDDGMQSAECTIRGHPNVCRTLDGRLFFATTQGLAMVDPGRVHVERRPPSVLIEALRVDGEPVAVDMGEVTIAPGSFGLEIRFTGINLSAPRRVRIQYQLAGHEAEWVDAESRRTAFYTQVPPGDYHFRVRAAGAGGVWNTQEASLGLRLMPHFWQTSWFNLGLAGGFTLVAGGLARFFLLRKYRRRLEHLEREHAIESERARIARDMHDCLGAELTQIGFQSQLLCGQLDPERASEERARADSILRSAANLVRGMDEVVWLTDPAKDNLESLAAYVSSWCEEFFQWSPVRLRIRMPLHLPDAIVPSESRHHLLLVVKEAMTNAVKHAQAGEVHLRFRIEEGRLTVIVEDDGCGLDVVHSSRQGNGIPNMHARMSAIGGTCEVVSRSEKGTRVLASIPLAAIPDRVA